MNLLKKSLILTLLISFSTVSFAQENVVKLRPGKLLSANLALAYERVIKESQSVNLAVEYQIPRSIPNGMPIGNNSSDSRYTGFATFAEYRFYTSDVAPSGFYIAPYLKFKTFSFSDSGEYEGVKATLDGSLITFGVGGQMGYQWIISDAFSIDWYFLGMSVDRHSLKAKYSANDGTDFDELKTDIEEELLDFPVIGNKISLTSGADFVSMKLPFFFPAFRGGVTVGYAF